MKPSLKVAVVAGGYIAALLVAFAAVALDIATTSGPDAQASSGMYAFGDALLFVAVFAACALVPTGAALFFLRPYRHFWTVLSALGLAVAVTGVTASNPLCRRQACAAFVPCDLGRLLRAQDPGCSTPRPDLFCVHNLLAAPLPSVRASRGNRDGSGSERVRRGCLVSPSVLPGAIAEYETPERASASHGSHDSILLGRAPRPGRHTWRAALCR
jgi:hypothetical protein